MARHFLRDDDLTPAEQAEVLDLAKAMKADRHALPPAGRAAGGRAPLRQAEPAHPGLVHRRRRRTRRPAARDRHGQDAHRPRRDDRRHRPGAQQAGRRDHLAHRQDRTASRSCAGAATVPVINALTDEFHPCQILADLQTVAEQLGSLAGRTLTYLGDGANNMAHSYLLGGATAGMHVRVAAPPGYQPDQAIVAKAQQIAARTGGSAAVIDDPAARGQGRRRARDRRLGLDGQGRRTGAQGRARRLPGQRRARRAGRPGAIVLHCLPAHRGEEITAEVIDGQASVVWDQAENRLHAQKALLAWLLEQP